MKYWLVLFLIPFVAFSQGQENVQSARLSYYFTLYSQVDAPSANTDKVLAFAVKLEHKRPSFKKEKDFLRYLFTKTHQQFLKSYSQYASFGQLAEREYNCLSGTALYALLLDHFNVPYKIIETNYHIFLLASTADGDVLFEATDPLHGFVDDAVALNNRLRLYKENKLQPVVSSKTFYQYKVNLYNEVNLDEMLGLLYYNLAIVDFNSRQLPMAIQHLGKALDLYSSPRIEELSHILMLSVQESNLDTTVKEKCLRSIYSLRKKQLSMTASAN